MSADALLQSQLWNTPGSRLQKTKQNIIKMISDPSSASNEERMLAYNVIKRFIHNNLSLDEAQSFLYVLTQLNPVFAEPSGENEYKQRLQSVRNMIELIKVDASETSGGSRRRRSKSRSKSRRRSKSKSKANAGGRRKK